MKRIVLVAVLALSIGTVMAPREADAHVVGGCNRWSSDDKVAITFFYTSFTGCGTWADIMSVISWVQYYDWANSRWDFFGWMGAATPNCENTAYVQSSVSCGGSYLVPPYLGVNCRRITSAHSVTHGNTIFGNTQSAGECF